jgi:hypothetical protein
VAGRVAGLAVVLVGLVAAWLARRLPAQAGFGLGPAFLPFWTGLVLAGCGAWLVLHPGPAEGTRAAAREVGRAALGVALLAGYAVLLEPLGYVGSTALFLAAGILGLDRAHPGRAVGLGLASAGVLVLIFRVWLRVPLPAGPLGW